MLSPLIAVLSGFVQGVLEWLPISSEGNLALVLTAIGSDPQSAVALALFLHLGTAISATAYYRDDIGSLLRLLPRWRRASEVERSTLTFLVAATLVSGVVGVAAFLLLSAFVSELAGGTFIGVVGVLLVATGLVERYAGGLVAAGRSRTSLVDALLVGVVQGLAILPGVSRSGTTTSVLLLRGHDGPTTLRLSFLLSIPAALGGGLIAVLQAGGVPSLSPAVALLALATAAVVGYVSIGLLMDAVRRVPFWGVCLALGGLSIVGWALIALA